MGHLRAMGPRWRRVTLVVAATATVTVLAAPSAAAAAPSPVTGVTVAGAGRTAAAVTVTWAPPGDPSYAGARVVVVPGSTPTTDPHDPGAVSSTDNATPATSVTVSGLAGGADYSVTVFAYDATPTYSAGASQTWTEPGTVTGLTTTGDDAGLGGVIHVAYSIPLTADRALVCVVDSGPPPASPVSPARCGTDGSGDVLVTAGHSVGLSVFGYSMALQGYGPPASATVAVPDNPPLGTTNDLLAGSAVDAHSVRLTWMIPLDSGAVRDLHDWVITRVAGTSPPPAGAAPFAVVPTPTRAGYDPISFLATGLPTERPFTFAVQARDDGGHLSAPAYLTIAARLPGTYAADDDRRGHRWRTVPLRCPASPETAAASLAVTPAGVAHAVFGCDASPDPRVYAATKRPGQPWTARLLLGRLHPGSPARVAVSPAGRLVAAWTGPDGPVVRQRPAGHGWGPAVRLPALTAGAPGWLTDVSGLAVDGRNRVHLLLVQHALPADRLYYVTNAGGRWTHALVRHAPGGLTWTAATITVDRALDQVVVATSEQTAGSRSVVRVVRASSRRVTLPASSTRADTVRGLAVSDVAAAGGRITVAVQGATGGVYLMTGRAAASVGAPLRVAGTGRRDTRLRLAMTGGAANTVTLAWCRSSAGWTLGQQGVFLAVRRYSPASGRWTTTRPVQRSDSHYDAPVAIARDRAGHLYVLVTREGS